MLGLQSRQIQKKGVYLWIYKKDNLRFIYHLEQSAPHPYHWTKHVWLLQCKMSAACKLCIQPFVDSNWLKTEAGLFKNNFLKILFISNLQFKVVKNIKTSLIIDAQNACYIYGLNRVLLMYHITEWTTLLWRKWVNFCGIVLVSEALIFYTIFETITSEKLLSWPSIRPSAKRGWGLGFAGAGACFCLYTCSRCWSWLDMVS